MEVEMDIEIKTEIKIKVEMGEKWRAFVQVCH